MITLLNTLYVMTPRAYLHLDNQTLRVEVEQQTRLRVPLHHLGAVVVFGDVLVSPAAIAALADDGKSLVLLDRQGRFKARMEGPVSGNILLRQAQFKQADDPQFVLNLARTLVAGKIKNSRKVLQRGARDSSQPDDLAALRGAVDHLAASLRAIPAAADLDAVRGIEGEAARCYFGVLSHLIKPAARLDFNMAGRTRRPPRDPMNALLSFLYALLMNDCSSALESVGLDRQLGCLHAVRPGRAALALDLMEEFRPLLADRLALTLINRGQIGPKHFEYCDGGAVLLSDEGRKIVVAAYQTRKQEQLQHPHLRQPSPVALLPALQARLLARHIRGEIAAYPPFVGG